jgi:phospholipid transport system substrate-binding protein
MISRRLVLAATGVALLAPLRAFAVARPDAIARTVVTFYDALLAGMKQGPKLGFAGRRDKLAPAMDRAFDLPLMTRLTVGPPWASLAPADQTKLVQAFSAFSIATYAQRFGDYSGEQFIVEPTATIGAGGDAIVHSKLVPKDGAPVELDYLLRQRGGDWRIIDVYLSGTVSELAARRSEFTAILRQGGAAALVNLLEKKTAELSG